MNHPENLQQQINERCPCMSKPIGECDCQTQEKDSFYTKDLLREAVVVQLPKPGERPIVPLRPSSFA